MLGGTVTPQPLCRRRGGANPNIFSSDGVTPKWRARDFGLVEIDKLLESHNGKVFTNEDFDRTSFSVFINAIDQPLPENEFDREEETKSENVKQTKRWKFW